MTRNFPGGAPRRSLPILKIIMYKLNDYEILRNEPLTDAVWRMVLAGDTQYITASGQFVDIALEGRFLRRPISVCDYDAATLTLVYKIVGDGWSC